MEVYGFLNTFFVASILISSILVVVLVYNFRQRLGAMEEKTETLLQIVNNVVQKLNNDNEDEIQNFVPLTNVNSDGYYGGNDMTAQYQDNEQDQEETDEDDEDDADDDEDDDEDDEDDTEGAIAGEDVDDEVEQVTEDPEEPESLKTEEYEKMNVTQLKQMVRERSLSNAVSKMKKPELVSLLVNE